MFSILAESLFTASRIRPEVGSRALRLQMKERERKFRLDRLEWGRDPYDP